MCSVAPNEDAVPTILVTTVGSRLGLVLLRDRPLGARDPPDASLSLSVQGLGRLGALRLLFDLTAFLDRNLAALRELC